MRQIDIGADDVVKIVVSRRGQRPIVLRIKPETIEICSTGWRHDDISVERLTDKRTMSFHLAPGLCVETSEYVVTSGTLHASCD